MNVEVRVVLRLLGFVLLVLSALIAGVGIFAVVDRLSGTALTDASDVAALWLSAFVGLLAGGLLYVTGRQMSAAFGQREALLLVAASWLFGAALAALPFRLWSIAYPDAAAAHDFDSYTNCYFEAMSGLTTAGSTILQDIESVPRSLLLWRALTQWLGGVGIVVLFVAVFPTMGVGGRRLFRTESTGPAPEGVTSRIRDTARALWLIYGGLTVLGIVLLRIVGMGWFDASCHMFTALSSGGFGTRNASIAAFDSSAIHIVLIAFMFFGSVNFGLYYRLVRGDWRSVISDTELRGYVLFLVTAILIVGGTAFGSTYFTAYRAAEGTGRAIRDVIFSVVSIGTTTGFATADYDQWGSTVQLTLLILMFACPCQGSTGGGLKMIRIVIAAKLCLAHLERTFRPQVVRSVKVGKSVIDEGIKLDTLVFILSFLAVYTIGSMLLMIFEADKGIDAMTAASAASATMNTTGPGFVRVGPTQNFAWLSDSSKWVLSALMVLGRLELFPLIALFSPRFWKTD